GFFLNDEPLRDCDPPDHEPMWPDDAAEIHTTGIIFTAAMWDMRKEFIAQKGMAAGVTLSDHYYHEALKRSVDIPSTYVEIMAADDDDGNLANGTPNDCTINGAFGRHGLVPPGTDIGIVVGRPDRDGWQLNIGATPSTRCPVVQVQSATVDWNLRGAAGA